MSILVCAAPEYRAVAAGLSAGPGRCLEQLMSCWEAPGSVGEMDDVWTVERHLQGKRPEVIALYHRFIELAQACGPFSYAVSKTAITLKGTRRGFAGAALGERALRGYLDLQRLVQDPRITRSSPYTKRLYVHHFRIDGRSQLDEQFAGWLGEAYQVGAGAHLGHPAQDRP